MPLGRKIKSALLRLPCGYGGSEFEKDEPGLIVPRMRSPPTRTGASDSVVASVPMVTPRARETRNSHEGPPISREGVGVGAEGVGAAGLIVREGGKQEVRQAPSPSPDSGQAPDVTRDSEHKPGPAEHVRSGTVFNNSESTHITDFGSSSEAVSPTLLLDRDPLHAHEQTPDPVKSGGEKPVERNSSLGNELGRNSSEDSQSSDYSNHSITQSLNPNSRPTSKVYYGQRYNGNLREERKQRFPPNSTIDSSETAGLRATPDTSSDRGPSRPLPRPPLGVVPSFIGVRKADICTKVENLSNDHNAPAGGYNGIKADEMSRGQDNQYTYPHAEAKEITLEEEQGYRNPERQTSAETISVHQETLDPVIHTVVRPIENEERTTVVTREIHYTDIHPIVQPIVDTERLPKKHYLETPDGKLVEISAEEAERQGWEEVWNGDLVPDDKNPSGFKVRDTGEAKVEDAGRMMAALELEHRNKAIPRPFNMNSTREEGVYEPYGNGDIVGDNVRGAPVILPLGFGVTGSSERIKSLHRPGSYAERNVLVGPAY